MIAIAGLSLAPFAWADPPSRVARLSYAAGAATFSPAGDEQWGAAVLNRPVVTGDRLWSDHGARVELTLDNGALWLGEATSVVVTNIDDRTTQYELQQGTVELRVRRLAPGSIVEVDTPNLAFQVTRPGRYRIAVDPQGGTTTVAVRNGAAEVYGEGASYAVGPGQAYRFYGTDLRDSEFVPSGSGDPFDRFVVERDARFSQSPSARYVSAEVVGYEDLDRYGTWRPAGDYGNVWFPRQVASDWAPYRQGHWSWIDPWGWTWVDDAPWGFAPFHYGRWAYVENRWGWVPGPRSVRPVYAPALVAFVGGANFSVSVSAGPAIGWFPLAPREVYRPAYNVSRDYYRQVNVSNTIVNTTVINNTYVTNFTAANAVQGRDVTYANLRARNAITAVPPAAFAQSLPVARAAVAVTPAQIDRAQVRAMAPVAPTRTAFIGGAPEAKSVPPRMRDQQVVVARSAPPPPPVPIAQRMQALDKEPGKPQDRNDMRTERPAPGGIAAERTVRVVNAGVPPAAAAPPAVKDSSGARAAQGGNPRNDASMPPVTPAPVPAAAPSRTNDARSVPSDANDRGRRNDSPASAAPPVVARPVAPSRTPEMRPPATAAPVIAAPPASPTTRAESPERARGSPQPVPVRPDPRPATSPPPRAEPAAPPPVPRAADGRAATKEPARPAAPPTAAPVQVVPPPDPRAAPQAERTRAAMPRDPKPDARPAPVAAPAPAPVRAPEARPSAAPPPPAARNAEPRVAPSPPAAAPPPVPAGAAPSPRGAPPRAVPAPDTRRDEKGNGNDRADDKRDGPKGKAD